jgi:HAD superfamily phosphatase (TIGR01668 family)
VTDPKEVEASMKQNPFFPTELVSSTYRIDFERLYEEGYRGIIFDIDNTLVPHGAPADQKAVRLFERLKRIGFACCLVSNNKKPRVDMFNKDIQVYSVYLAHKPLSGGYRRAMEKMGTNKENTIVVGDQIFTDLWGGSFMGLKTIMVLPINPKEEIQIVLKRFLERPILWMYRHSRAFSNAHERKDPDVR